MTFTEFLNQQIGDISRYKLSKMTGISYTQIKNYLSGTSEPTVKNADKICKALNTTFLIGREK